MVRADTCLVSYIHILCTMGLCHISRASKTKTKKRDVHVAGCVLVAMFCVHFSAYEAPWGCCSCSARIHIHANGIASTPKQAFYIVRPTYVAFDVVLFLRDGDGRWRMGVASVVSKGRWPALESQENHHSKGQTQLRGLV